MLELDTVLANLKKLNVSDAKVTFDKYKEELATIKLTESIAYSKYFRALASAKL